VAEIAADQGGGHPRHRVETQFQFQGIISSQKPFRDWLTEVLNCCLGFYTWEFGKLKLGCRINASAVDAYTLANSLFQSLRLTPIQAGFEHLVLSFADVAYQYQANTAEVLRQEPRGPLRARRISAHQPDALGGVLDLEPGVADRSHSHARGDRPA